jgi:hypothetical protein
MEINNLYYSQNLKQLCNEVPSDSLKEIIEELSTNAIFYMGSQLKTDDINKINTEIINLLKKRFRYLPLLLVGEAFISGSLGELGGTTRFYVANVYKWFLQMEEKAQRIYTEGRNKIDENRRLEDERLFRNNKGDSSLFGLALHLKLVWVYEHKIDAKDWDYYTLDKIVEQFRLGKTNKTLSPSMS